MNTYPRPREGLRALVRSALEEDLGRGDITTDACVPADAPGDAVFVARAPLVSCGADILREVFAQLDPTLKVSEVTEDGERVKAGSTLARVTGRAAPILKGERVALNFAQRLSGIATMTRSYVDRLPSGSSTRIVDTRKTTPGLRSLERHAVRCGGAHNHREDLSSAVLIKDNHIAASGGIEAAIGNARRAAPHTTRIECEVDTLEQLEQALAAGADIVLLDNFSDEQTRQAVERNAGRALLEASGGITLERITSLAKIGVDVISVGALTHSAPAVDIGLDWRP